MARYILVEEGSSASGCGCIGIIVIILSLLGYCQQSMKSPKDTSSRKETTTTYERHTATQTQTKQPYCIKCRSGRYDTLVKTRCKDKNCANYGQSIEEFHKRYIQNKR